MMQSPKSNDGVTILPRSSAILLLVTVADTTWRMFVPTIGGTLVGIMLDHLFYTAPWWTVIMVIVGSSVSVLLIRTQIKSLRSR